MAYLGAPVAGLLPLLIALALVEAANAGGPPATAADAWWAAGGVVLGGLLGEVAAHLLARRRHLIDRADQVVQMVTLVAFAALCLGTGWVRLVPTHTLALAPWFLLQVLWWWSMPVALGGPWTRRGFLVHQLRFGLMPLALLLPIADLCDYLGRLWRIDWWIDTHLGRGANIAGSFLLMAGILLLLPAVLVRLWGARPLADRGLAERLDGECRRLGVPVAGVLAWPTEGGRVHNAVVIGLLPRLRWVLITDDLLRDLGEDGVRAVLGHELGHARHRHLVLYLLFAAAGGMASWWATTPLMDLLGDLPGASAVEPQIRQALVAILLLAVVWRGLFGVVSRLCERQADLVGLEATGDPRHLEEALLTVARGSGTDPAAPSWRHFSIADRIAFIRAVAADPALGVRHHGRVRWLGAILVLATAALGLTLLASGAFAPPT